MDLPPCPANSFRYNSTLCACEPGYYSSSGSGGGGVGGGGGGRCTLFRVSPGDGDWVVKAGVDSSPTFLMTIFSFDSLKRFTKSQAIFLEVTLVVLALWLAFCAAVRLGRVHAGRSIWFRLRWWISRLDVCFSTQHWLGDNKVVMKRKTELGGTFSVASGILFVGLLAALLYQVIAKRNIEMHRIRPTNAPDFISFINDMEFNITTISSMSCSHLRGLDTLTIGTPGFIDYRAFPLSTYANYTCYNTSRGPTVSLKCNSCQFPRGSYYISWQFVDLPNNPATAVGFVFNLTAKDHGDDRRVSFVSGTVNSGSYINDRPKTFRGRDINILKIHLFPQIFHNLHDLRLIQPLFHDFLPGSSFSETNQLQASLQNSKDGLINTTLYIRFLSEYIVEINNENVLGPVSFLADVGGLYAISISIFLYILFQCENRIKKFRNEDSVMRDTRCQLRAQRHWDKVRKYVMYTWGPSNLDGTSINQPGNAMTDSFRGVGSLHRTKLPARKDSIYFDKMINTHNENVVSEIGSSERVESSLASSATNFEERPPYLDASSVLGNEMCDIKEEDKKEHSDASYKRDPSQPQAYLCRDDKKTILPLSSGS